jgi:hypothetical protein
MNLYDRLKDKNKFELLGKQSNVLYTNCVESMQEVTYQHELTIFYASNIYWILYPMDVFDLTRFFNLFELA